MPALPSQWDNATNSVRVLAHQIVRCLESYTCFFQVDYNYTNDYVQGSSALKRGFGRSNER